MAKLQVHDSAGVRDYELEGPEISVGRELDNALRLPDPSVSRHHGLFRRRDGAWEVVDLQSSNGVLVNGDRVQAHRLADGDRITLGQVRLTFRDPRSAGVPAEGTVPAGTVRMSREALAAFHASRRPGDPAPPLQPAPGPPPPAPSPTGLRRFFRWILGGGR